jgi:uncharacterized protein (TIGR02246 family)
MGIVLLLSGICLAAGSPKPQADEAAIRKAVESYSEAYNRGDAGAMAFLWSREGEYVTPSGERSKGPDKIRAALETFFAKNKGIQAKVANLDVQFPAAGRAVSKGLAVVQLPGQEADEIMYTAAWIKEKGAWKLVSVEEFESPVPVAAMAQLGQLEWLMGDWVDRDEHASVETAFRWAKNYSFINGSFRVHVAGRVDMEGAQVIGWDPVTKKIRSWIFDSKGGFGQGEWTKEGNQWKVNFHSVLATGEKASAINIYTYVDPNTFTWQSTGREVNGAPLPNLEAVTVVRKESQAIKPASGK